MAMAYQCDRWHPRIGALIAIDTKQKWVESKRTLNTLNGVGGHSDAYMEESTVARVREGAREGKCNCPSLSKHISLCLTSTRLSAHDVLRLKHLSLHGSLLI